MKESSSLVSICITISSSIGSWPESEEKRKYDELLHYLNEIRLMLFPFNFIDKNWNSDEPYREYLPIMEKMERIINEFNIYQKLYYWHYAELDNNEEELNDITKLAESFLNYIRNQFRD